MNTGLDVTPHPPPPLLSQRVGAQVAFEKAKALKPGYHITVSRVETRRFQAMGKLDSTCAAAHQCDSTFQYPDSDSPAGAPVSAGLGLGAPNPWKYPTM
jgi:hypothetical protein